MPEQSPFSDGPDSLAAGDGNNHRPGRNRKKPWIISGAALAVVLAAGAVVAPMVLDDEAAPAAAPSPTGTPFTMTPKPEPTLAPAPVFNYYEQAGPPAGSPLNQVEPLAVTVVPETTGTSLPAGLIGLSLEATDLADPSLSGDNPEMVQSISGLGKPLLRFGGNAVDRRFFWTSTGEAIPGNLSGDKAHPVRAVTPADLERVNTLLEAVDGQIALTVDLGNYDPARAADMTKFAAAAFGERLVGITVGNEPNGFAKTGLRPGGYGIQDYLTELQAYATAMHAVAPQVPIVGPGTYEESWWGPFAEVQLPQRKILSFHHYPLSSCEGADPAGEPVMSALVTRHIHDHANNFRGAALEPALTAGIETWIPETGVSACPGSNETTKTHASALWSADYALSAAQLGISRVSFHSSLLTCTGGPPMSAICAGGAYLQPNGVVDERANYYGLSMVGEMEPGEFLKLDTSGTGMAYPYAVRHADGSISVVVVNNNNPETDAQTTVSLELPGKALTGTMTQMTGPSYAAEDGTLIDGAAAEGTPAAERLTVPGFEYGSSTQTFPLTAGTVTVLNFTF
ncbi:hypothetical protein QNO08_11635 [Arthrobacter sp. zg-Y820]|uniref:hypothetical protein n=1 Tax=unclassified Arthrobacter TaxID=235627 RepID=UPI001E304E65|nr:MULTISPECIES: hypothetical protein [unclassified Arthrobacter]MCC9196232.1 hypothetical protein [Arthrobacter sp. zg-Y820]MDK1279093.1 hypothetical protein [Arthrobacter sp. zg.Y820]MDK1359291.1 hypothetical protein [Arthrobacter sp. zg-Y1219]WIB08500.1 hypothetical protein QNO08_11635 [Arthrobacter sp. zg-Y820]